MSKTIEGIFRDGKVELTETPSDISEGTRVIVIILPPDEIDYGEHNITRAQAAELRARFTCFAEDWESPEMSIYDNYDEEKSKLEMKQHTLKDGVVLDGNNCEEKN